MTEKKCNECQIVKPVSEFGKEARALNGYKPRCKHCLNAYYNSKYKDFKEAKLKQLKQYYQGNTEKIKQRRKAYYQKHKVKLNAKNKEWNLLNKEKIAEYKREYVKKRRKTDQKYRLGLMHRKLIYRLSATKKASVTKLLGYNLGQLILSLGKLPELNEAIDHKIPMSWFTSNAPASIISHLDNLQIITRSENSVKGNRICHPIPKRYLKIIKPFIQKDKLKKIQTI